MIYAEVSRQRLKIYRESIAADTIDYLEMRFTFTNGWNGFEKWAHFAHQKTGEVYDIRLTDDCIRKEDHLNLSAGRWTVYLHGNRYRDGEVVERVTTLTAGLEVSPTGMLDGEPFPEIPATVAEQILARLDEVEQNSGGVSFETGNALELKDGVLNVITTDEAQEDNTLPITSTGVYTIVGNIGAILDTI